MGGRLLVASEVGVGTTFRVELDKAAAGAPARPDDARDPGSPWWPAGEHSEATVLYVEDNPPTCSSCRTSSPRARASR